jgi:hypothetical protein
VGGGEVVSLWMVGPTVGVVRPGCSAAPASVVVPSDPEVAGPGADRPGAVGVDPDAGGGVGLGGALDSLREVSGGRAVGSSIEVVPPDGVPGAGPSGVSSRRAAVGVGPRPAAEAVVVGPSERLVEEAVGGGRTSERRMVAAADAGSDRGGASAAPLVVEWPVVGRPVLAGPRALSVGSRGVDLARVMPALSFCRSVCVSIGPDAATSACRRTRASSDVRADRMPPGV